MASIYKHADGYRAQVRKRGLRTSGVFRTRAEASRWAAGIERDLEDRRLGLPAKKTWRDAVERYRLAVSSKKRTATSEDRRLTRLLQVPFADMSLVEIKADDWVQWRDSLGIKPASTNRMFSLIKHVYRHICVDWEWLPTNPMHKIRRLPAPPGRRLQWTQEAIAEMVGALGYPGHAEARQRVALGFLFALETGMRAGEVFGLRRSDISGRVARLAVTKNGHAREVPLSPRALQILEPLGDDLFDVGVGTADALFRKYRPAHLKHLRFHDARHTAAISLGKRLPALSLCAVMGWRDPRQAMTYFHPSADDLAASLWPTVPPA
jgi:integrase